MIFKDKTVFDKDLLDTYKLKPCILTGEMGTHAQHRCKRSKLRLDIPENLEPVNDYINGLLLLSLPCFIEEMNKDYGNRKEEMIATFNRNTGKKYSTWHQIWSYLTDEDEEIYKRYRKCVLFNKSKPKSDFKITSKKFRSKESMYKKKIDGTVVLR